MESFLIKAFQLIISLSIIVVIHEMGHFLTAKFFKTKVEKFYLFFNPWFSLFKIKRGETEYGLGWIPLGGYVKIAGMIDESMDKEQMKKDPQPWEFRSKPAWQRLIIITGGVIFNLILGGIIYSMILFTWGEKYISVKDAKYGVRIESSVAKNVGFKNGDIIKKINGKEIENTTTYNDLTIQLILITEKTKVLVENSGKKRIVTIPEDFGQQILAKKEKQLFIEGIPIIIDSILANSPAEVALLKKGDKIISFNEKNINFFSDFEKLTSNNKNKEVLLKVKRNFDTLNIPINISKEGTIGFYNKSIINCINITTKEYGFFESFPAGITKAIKTISSYIDQFSLVFTKEGAKSIGGFGAIGNLFPVAWDWRSFWGITAFISLALAFMNILPIPALDGGHAVFIVYEMITRKKPNEKVLEKAQIIGIVILLSLLVYSNGNDIFRLFN